MIIKAIKIKPSIEIKIFNKHGITIDEIEKVLTEDKPYFAKSKESRYISIGIWSRHITIIFEYYKNEAEIITAYPSPKWQISLYKRKMKLRR